MSKKDKINPIFIVLIIVGILLISQGNLFSLIPNSGKINCVSSSSNTLSCSLAGGGNIRGENNVFSLNLNKPSNTAQRRGMILGMLSGIDSETREFLETHTPTGDQSGYCIPFYNPDDTNVWTGRLPVTSRGDGIMMFNWCERYDEIASPQLMTIEGTTSKGENFKIVGLCNAWGRTCEVEDPFPDDVDLFPSSININFKLGGFDLDTDCISDGTESCDGSDLLVCSNFNWINQGMSAGKCGTECVIDLDCQTDFKCSSNKCVALEKADYYRFSDNKCFQIELLLTQVTNNDYSTQELCEENIEKESNLFLILGIGIVGFFLFFIFKKFSKRRR